MKRKKLLSDLLIDIADSANFETSPGNDSEIEVLKVILDEKKAEKYQRKPGLYYTVSTKIFREGMEKRYDDLAKVVSDILHDCADYYEIKKITSKALIVGLGNVDVPSDSLGPNTVKKINVTNHLIEMNLVKKLNRVITVIPGVMGQTGLETTEIVKSLAENFKPSLIVVIDALASRSISRLNSTIQITTSGISPGSGISGNKKEISYETAGIPVIAIGIPLVVDYFNIINELFEDKEAKKKALENMPGDPHMFVSSKDIQNLIVDMSSCLAKAINHFLNPSSDNLF
ncbi:MAG: GPR endopeptidase [Erysipelotrichales bacterium]|nr:GPR endopeptidase [Erysipelotrichales bacterium]